MCWCWCWSEGDTSCDLARLSPARITVSRQIFATAESEASLHSPPSHQHQHDDDDDVIHHSMGMGHAWPQQSASAAPREAPDGDHGAHRRHDDPHPPNDIVHHTVILIRILTLLRRLRRPYHKMCTTKCGVLPMASAAGN